MSWKTEMEETARELDKLSVDSNKGYMGIPDSEADANFSRSCCYEHAAKLLREAIARALRWNEDK